MTDEQELPKEEASQEEAPSLGINVAEHITTGEKFGGSPPPPDEIEANAVALILMDKNNNMYVRNVAFLTPEKTPQRFKKGLRYDFRVRFEV
jgi:hypothetical protein